MKITPSQFDAYFKDKEASDECPFCKNKQWSVPALGEEPHTYLPDETMDVHESWIPLVPNAIGMISTSGPYIPVVTLTCAKCGFVRQQHVILLKMWLEKKVAEDDV
jgi:hypothetical protein